VSINQLERILSTNWKKREYKTKRKEAPGHPRCRNPVDPQEAPSGDRDISVFTSGSFDLCTEIDLVIKMLQVSNETCCIQQLKLK
jgi:hypothetical protein